MSTSDQQPRTFRFGIFELDGDTGEIRKEGKSQPRLREQSFRILLLLLERPGELVTREVLRQRLWSSDTFVDFDHGLNTAINQLRGAFNDSSGKSSIHTNTAASRIPFHSARGNCERRRAGSSCP